MLFRSRKIQKEKVDFLQALNENLCSLEMTEVLAAIEEAVEGRLLAAEEAEPTHFFTGQQDFEREEFLVVKVTRLKGDRVTRFFASGFFMNHLPPSP
jgi:hypothetical protein